MVRVGGREVPVPVGAIIGRSSSADVTVAHDMVSRKHAQVNRNATGWFLSDLGSLNGTYENGDRTNTVLLRPGTTTITLGPPEDGCLVELEVPEPLTGRGPDFAVDTMQSPAVVTRRVARQHQSITPPQDPTDVAPQPVVAVPAPQSVASAAPPSGLGGERRAGVTVRGANLSVIVDDELVILDDASLTLRGGTLTAVIGPSGCGKSTLANVLSGRSEPSRGVVEIDGQPMSPDVRQRIGAVPQYDAVHERLTVRRALEAAARLRLPAETSRREIRNAVVGTAEALDLDERLDTRIAKLSGGQKQRVSVGYELVADPIVLVLDEPTAGLDPGLEQELISELRAIADRGTTTILVTHSTVAAEQADQVVVMAPGGHVAFIGSPADVLDHFGTTEWAEVFTTLGSRDGAELARRFATTDAYNRFVNTPGDPPSGDVITRSSRSWSHDFAVMTLRYARTIVADWRSLLLLAAQAPILGLLFAWVLSQRVFIIGLNPSTAAREFVLAIVLAMVWIGASNSIREIVKERITFVRERAVGVSASSLVASRWLVLAVITVFQSVVLYYAAVSRQEAPLDAGVLLPSGAAEMIIALAAVGLASVGIGLVISGAAHDANKAMAVLPIVLIPVIVFSGLLIPTSRQAVLEIISWLNPIQWGSSAAAVTANVLEKEGCNPTGIQAQLQQVFLGRTLVCSNPRWQTTVLAQAVNLGGAIVSVAVLVTLSFVVTDRSTRNLRS